VSSISPYISGQPLPGYRCIHSTHRTAGPHSSCIHSRGNHLPPACGVKPQVVAIGHTLSFGQSLQDQTAFPSIRAVANRPVEGLADFALRILSVTARDYINKTYKNLRQLPAFWRADCFYWNEVRQSSVRITPTPNAIEEAGTDARDIQSNVRQTSAADPCLARRAISRAVEAGPGAEATNRPAAGTRQGPRLSCKRQAGCLTALGQSRGSVLADGTNKVGNRNGSLERKESDRD